MSTKSLLAQIDDLLSGRRRWLVVAAPFEEVTGRLPDKAADLWLCDPPYSMHVHANARASKRGPGRGKGARVVDLGFDFLTPSTREALAREAARLSRRWALHFTNVEGVADWIRDGEAAGLQYVRTCAWHRLGGAPQFSGDRPAQGFECIVAHHPKGKKRWNGGGHAGHWSVPIVRAGRLHPSEKPVSLLETLVQLFSDPGDLVVDAMCGSASTGVAALRLGRRFLGCERDPGMAQIAIERLEREEREETPEDAKRRQVPLFGAAR